MKISIRRKIILTYIIFILASGCIWFLGYYQLHVINQKLQVIERKNRLFNDILEARRYEKNFFITLNPGHIGDALSYVHQAEQRLSEILQGYSRFTLAKDLDLKMDELRAYEKGLSNLFELYTPSGTNVNDVNDSRMRTAYKLQESIRELGKILTEEMEKMINLEQRSVKKLISGSRNYFILGLIALFIVSCFTALFLIFNVNRPLKSIESAIHKIAGGAYDDIPPISTGDEFESLVDSLNSMISELHRRNEQLIQTEKMASLGTLTSGVAHELNNPLNNISTSIQIVLEELEDGNLDYKRDLLQETEKQIDRARDIVKALLEFSRERSFTLVEVSFKDLVEKTIKLIKGEMPSDVELKVDVPVAIRGEMDPRRIQQVLINLILNGVQSMEEGGLLNIRAYPSSDENGFFVEVADTGSGIAPENISKIFDPFFTTKHVGRGAGLGLSISHGIIERHGGRIDVTSEPGKGTTFKIFLPSYGDSLH